MVTKNYMSGLFGRSPITPLQEHMHRVYQGVKHLIPLVEGMIEPDHKKVLQAQEKFINGEHDADVMKKAFINLVLCFIPLGRD